MYGVKYIDLVSLAATLPGQKPPDDVIARLKEHKANVKAFAERHGSLGLEALASLGIHLTGKKGKQQAASASVSAGTGTAADCAGAQQTQQGSATVSGSGGSGSNEGGSSSRSSSAKKRLPVVAATDDAAARHTTGTAPPCSTTAKKRKTTSAASADRGGAVAGRFDATKLELPGSDLVVSTARNPTGDMLEQAKLV